MSANKVLYPDGN